MATKYAKKTLPSSYFIASSDASLDDKSRADFTCSGTGDQAQINTYIAALIAAKGGTIYLSAGTFNLASTIAITGDGTSNGPTIAIIGAGNENTQLTPATNTHAITISGATQVKVWDMKFNLTGSSDAIHGTAPTAGAPYWSFWQSSFKNLYVRGDFSAHSGWVLNLENPFRSTFENIEGQGIGNGIYLKSTNSNFNPGNCVFIRCFMDLNGAANGVGYKLHTTDGNGLMNILTFLHCEAIDSKTSSTSSIGWYFLGSTTDYHATKDVEIYNSNIEQFNTCVKMVHAVDNYIDLSYADTKTGGTGTIFDLSSTTQGSCVKNELYARSGYVPTGTTTVLINDSNTDATSPNIVGKFDAYAPGTLSKTVASATATLFTFNQSSGGGTIDAALTGSAIPATAFFNYKLDTTTPTNGQVYAYNSTSGKFVPSTPSSGGGSGTVTSVSVVTANGLAGTVATNTTTPAITLSTSVTGLLKGNGTAISAATSGTDYVIPTGYAQNVSRTIAQTSHGFVVGNVIYWNGTTYVKSNGNASSTAEVDGMVSSVIDSNNFILTSIGYVSSIATGAMESGSSPTAGTTYFLSSTTAGTLTATAPTTTGYVSKPVFRAVSTTAGYFIDYRGIAIASSGGGGSSKFQIQLDINNFQNGGTPTYTYNSLRKYLTWSGDIYINAILPHTYAGGGVTLYFVYYNISDSDTGHNIQNSAAFSRLQSGTTNVTTTSFASSNSMTARSVTNTYTIFEDSITFTDGTQMNGLVAGEGFTLKLTKGGSLGSNLALAAVYLKEN